MDYEIIWSDRSQCDLREIVTFIAKDDAAAAERLGHEIIETTEPLRTFPEIDPAFPRGSDGPFREILCGRYRIFYAVDHARKRIEIVTVWHSARGTPRLP